MEEIYTVIPDDFERAGAASTSLKDLLKKLGLSPELIRRIAIGTYEGEMNCLIHGGGGRIRAEIGPQDIRVSIEDHGPGIPDAGRLVYSFRQDPGHGIRSRDGAAQYEKSF